MRFIGSRKAALCTGQLSSADAIDPLRVPGEEQRPSSLRIPQIGAAVERLGRGDHRSIGSVLTH